MIKRYFSSLSFQYERTLIYMLQQVEYDVSKYLKWLARVKDFGVVQKRGRMVETKKARLIFLCLALIVLVYTGLVFWWGVQDGTFLGVGVTLILVLIIPIWARYIIVLPLVLGKIFIQNSVERKVLSSAQKKLESHKGLRIVVIGSYGKTTAKEVLKTVLAGGKKVSATPGNINQPLGLARFIENLDGDEEVLIFELGEYRPGDILKMCELVRPDMAFITGVSEAHLENFGSVEEITKSLFEVREYNPEIPLYLNGDNELLRTRDDDNSTLYDENGLENERVKDVTVTAFGTDFKLGRFNVHSKLLGRHNIGVVAASVYLAGKLGVSEKEIKMGLTNLAPFEHRMCPRALNGAVVIDDSYNGNLEGVKAGARLMSELEAKRKVLVTPGLVEQGAETESIHIKIGLTVASVFDVVVLMQNSVTEFIKAGLDEADFRGELLVVADPLEFYQNLDKFVAEGDIMLLQNDWTDNYE